MPARSVRAFVLAAALGILVVLPVAGCSSAGSADAGDAAASTPGPASATAAATASGSAFGSASASASASTSTAASAAPAGTATSAKPSSATAQPAPSSKQVQLPQAGAKFDYQIGGAYPPPSGVRIVSRDSGDSPAAGLYNICYLNAFQAQPGLQSWWQSNHPDLLLRGSDGSPVIDQDWNEPLLDVSTAAKRSELAQVEDGWIDGCAHKGFQAVEPDNLDSYQRSNGLLTSAENVAFAALLARHAHADGLAIGQKNASELLPSRGQVGFDFAVAEQCGVYGECGLYAAAYSDRVVDVEYDDNGFAKACSSWGSRLSIVRRDLDVTPKNNSAYVFRTC